MIHKQIYAVFRNFKREIEVAVSKHSQPVWFRITKWVLIIAHLYFFWGSEYLFPGFLVALVFSLALHFWYRYKTDGWKKSYVLWKQHESGR